MDKPFKTIDEQILILEQRNLKFKDKEEARQILLYSNYYNIINQFSKFLIENEKYYDDVYFEDILIIKQFDKDFKKVLYYYLIEVESLFKSILSYVYCETFKNNRYVFLDINCYNNKKVVEASKIIGDFSKILNKYSSIKGDNSIKHYIIKYDDVPFWVLSNYLTFGQTIEFFKVLDEQTKTNISKEFSKLLTSNLDKEAKVYTETIESYLENIRILRNAVAHNNKIIDFRCRNNNKYHEELHSKYNVAKRKQRQDIFNIIITLQCFLTKNQYEQFRSELLLLIEKLKKEINNKYADKILRSLGIKDGL